MSAHLTVKDLQLCYDLVAIQTNAPQGCEPQFINDLEDLRVKLQRLLASKQGHWIEPMEPKDVEAHLS